MLFKRPHDDVVKSWRRAIAHAYSPEQLFERFKHQCDVTYHRTDHHADGGKLTLTNLRRGLILGFNILTRVGLFSDYRKPFWRAAGYALKRGQIEAVFNMGFVAHPDPLHPRALRGEHNASFYAAQDKARRRPPRGEGPAGGVR